MYQINKTVVNVQNRNISRCRLSKVKWLKHKCWKSSVHLNGPVTDTLALVHLMHFSFFLTSQYSYRPSIHLEIVRSLETSSCKPEHL